MLNGGATHMPDRKEPFRVGDEVVVKPGFQVDSPSPHGPTLTEGACVYKVAKVWYCKGCSLWYLEFELMIGNPSYPANGFEAHSG